MRSFGGRRGNPVLGAALQMAARRRAYATLAPHAGESDAEVGAPFAARFSRAFFDRIREHVLPRMVPALEIEGGHLRYFGAEKLRLWALEGPQALVLAYEHSDTPALLRERSERWLKCVRTRTAPGMVTPHWGHPVYGARLDPARDELDVVWATPGDWCGFVLAEEPEATRFALPPWWPAQALASA